MSNSPTITAETAGNERVTVALPPIHPGEHLADEMTELGLSANALARALDVPVYRVTEILAGRRGITADTALRLSRYFGTTPEVWLRLQLTYDLRKAKLTSGARIAATVRSRAA